MSKTQRNTKIYMMHWQEQNIKKGTVRGAPTQTKETNTNKSRPRNKETKSVCHSDSYDHLVAFWVSCYFQTCSCFSLEQILRTRRRRRGARSDWTLEKKGEEKRKQKRKTFRRENEDAARNKRIGKRHLEYHFFVIIFPTISSFC